MASLVDAQHAVVAMDYGQFWLWTDGWDPDDLDIVALIERAQARDNIAQERHGLVVLSPHQNNFEMPFRVERWSAPADDDLAQWQEAFEAHLVVGEYGVTYETPTLDGEGFDVPAGTYHALITGRGFVAHGWPGSTTPGDEWRMRLWPADEAFEPRRLLAWEA